MVFDTVFILWSLIAVAAILLLFFGYPTLVFLLGLVRSNPWEKDDIVPPISVIIPSHGEDKSLIQKILCTATQYPRNKLQIIVVYSNPMKAMLLHLESFQREGLISLVIEPFRSGKSSAINLALSKAKAEICIITDSDCALERNSLKKIVRSFADDKVGAVSGQVLRTSKNPERKYHNFLFNSFQTKIKNHEAKIDSCSHAPGELLAFRRTIVNHISSDSICDDYYVLLAVRRKGYRCVSEPLAIAKESSPPTILGKLRRTRRVVAGTLIEAARFKSMMFNPSFGFFGLMIFPSYIFRITFLPILTMLSVASLLIILFQIVATLTLPLTFLFLLGAACLLLIGRKFFIYALMLILGMLLGLMDYLTGHYSPIWKECK